MFTPNTVGVQKRKGGRQSPSTSQSWRSRPPPMKLHCALQLDAALTSPVMLKQHTSPPQSLFVVQPSTAPWHDVPFATH